MTKEVVLTYNAVPPLTTFCEICICSRATLDVRTIFTIVEGGVQGQTFAALENMGKVLKAAGSGLQHVVKANVYLTNLTRDFSDMNTTYMTFFEENAMPARTCVGVASLPLGASVEIECVAELPDA
ncbi:Endoribonuclease L-PSP [Suillus subalutaceus]|uniref:Endoribonuclease L-PSP n=1 Tax=Suillus subalutaceus TaxID=48586 RepID=UPI001B87A37A|nr:Endoribonuclease L-PSP [Suillus subalutaceus]KAG1841244.1 Endoribonuclease L-PSP [Suillus subalutaceus]